MDGKHKQRTNVFTERSTYKSYGYTHNSSQSVFCNPGRSWPSLLQAFCSNFVFVLLGLLIRSAIIIRVAHQMLRTKSIPVIKPLACLPLVLHRTMLGAMAFRAFRAMEFASGFFIHLAGFTSLSDIPVEVWDGF